MQWIDQYSVNIKALDEQHQQLIGMVNELDKAMRQGRGKQVLSGILSQLSEYTQQHFAAEEHLMQTHGYPGYEEHRDKHRRMAEKVAEVRKQFNEGKVSITLEVMRFLCDWVDKHIQSTDKSYTGFLNGKGVY